MCLGSHVLSKDVFNSSTQQLKSAVVKYIHMQLKLNSVNNLLTNFFVLSVCVCESERKYEIFLITNKICSKAVNCI